MHGVSTVNWKRKPDDIDKPQKFDTASHPEESKKAYVMSFNGFGNTGFLTLNST